MTKWTLQKLSHRTTHKQVEHQETTFIKTIVCFSEFSFSSFLFIIPKWFLQEMLSYRLGTVNEFHLGFKPILSYSKPHIFLTFLEEKEKNMHLLSPTRDALQCHFNRNMWKLDLVLTSWLVKGKHDWGVSCEFRSYSQMTFSEKMSVKSWCRKRGQNRTGFERHNCQVRICYAVKYN